MTDASDTTDAVDESGSQEHFLRHDMEGSKPLAVSIATAVGEATGTDPLRLPPLGRVVEIDFDALDALFTTAATTDGANVEGTRSDSASGGSDIDAERPGTTVRFFYHGHEVVVHGDGRIRVRGIE